MAGDRKLLDSWKAAAKAYDDADTVVSNLKVKLAQARADLEQARAQREQLRKTREAAWQKYQASQAGLHPS